jgi:hypothetical protein
MRHAVEGDISFSAANCSKDFRVGDEATLARMVPTLSGMRTRGLLPPLLLPVTFPVARHCSSNVFTVFLALVLVFEPALDCDNRICLQKPFHKSSFLLCR